MKRKFQQKIILSFLLIFTAYTCGIVAFEHQRAKQHKRDAMEEKLSAYAEVVTLNGLGALLPSNLRITLLDSACNALYDNVVSNYSALENHADRPEVIEAIRTGSGSSIRNSASNNEAYLYYAKKINNKIIRVALPYDEQLKFFFKPSNEFLYFVVTVFFICFAFILYVGNYFGKFIRQLRDFSQSNEMDSVAIPKFPKDEIGEIGARLAEDFRRIKEDEKRLAQEKEKLLMHIQSSAEGVCFFNANRTVAFYNGLFLQYFNIISNQPLTTGKEITFLNQYINEDCYETHISGQGNDFLLRTNMFEDKSFEMILVDITAREKTRRLKQEMTGNIAHELRTPVTSIRGFLEILINNNIPEEKKRDYMQRAFLQTQVLSELISDMSLLTKIDEKAESLRFEKVQISQLIANLHEDLSIALKEKSIAFHSNVPESIVVSGNPNLLYSIFRNLTENVLRHAGNNIDINIKLHEIKDGKAYFIFADNGKGIENETHLSRLFERFYRAHEGRTRDTGGSGLGLSIVKNAVVFHGGAISVKKGSKGGLEFLFSLIPINPRNSVAGTPQMISDFAIRR
ncbi:MAG: HAMP domain-containing histidine kinase [Fibromonadaceae bacterium]|jgi:signal transduction histidine kinase|nr:HAMP domain-containing histidine kinase [Fibromonadaceae bacterium]